MQISDLKIFVFKNLIYSEIKELLNIYEISKIFVFNTN